MKMKAPKNVGALSVDGVTFTVLKGGVLSTDGKVACEIGLDASLALAEHGCVPVGDEAVPDELRDKVAEQEASAAASARSLAEQKDAFARSNPHIAPEDVDAKFEDMLALSRQQTPSIVG